MTSKPLTWFKEQDFFEEFTETTSRSKPFVTKSRDQEFSTVTPDDSLGGPLVKVLYTGQGVHQDCIVGLGGMNSY